MTDLALRRQVAERLGYRYWKEKRGEYELAVAKRPNDREPWKSSRSDTEDRYAEIDYTEACRINFFGVDVTPKWDTDIAAAWELLEDMGDYCYQINPPHGGCMDYRVATAESKTDGSVRSFYDPNPAAAICKAWLKYKEHHDDRQTDKK